MEVELYQVISISYVFSAAVVQQNYFVKLFHIIFIIDTLHKEFDVGGDGIKNIADCPR